MRNGVQACAAKRLREGLDIMAERVKVAGDCFIRTIRQFPDPTYIPFYVSRAEASPPPATTTL